MGLLQSEDATTSTTKHDLGFAVNNSTWAQQIQPLAENQWSVNVPSETTFTLNIAAHPNFIRYRAFISEPLQPNETRDITEFLTPVPPDSGTNSATNTNPVTRTTAN